MLSHRKCYGFFFACYFWLQFKGRWKEKTMNNMRKAIAICLFGGCSLAANAAITTITFDEAIDGAVSHFFDGNNDGKYEAIFSTTDPFGFNTVGPGFDQLYINEPGLEGTTGLTPDLRVDFLQGAVGSIGFGFATISPLTGVFQVFDQSHIQIASQAFAGDFFNLDTGEPVVDGESGSNVSGFPEGRMDLPFENTAAYVMIDFNEIDSEFAGRYIIDNFTFETAGTDTITLFDGATPDFPVLPDPFDPDNPEFKFELEILEDGLGTLFPIFIDPIIAVGYTYTVSGSNVATILIPSSLPNGDSDFIIVIDGIEYAISAGVTFDILSETGIVGGVETFEIKDISTAEALDPANALAFNTGLTFVDAGAVSVTQTPIMFDTDAQSVPEPGTLLLFALGLLGFGSVRKFSNR